MASFQISVSPSRRAAGRFITKVRRAIQKALAEEKKKSGLTQSEIARRIGVHRSVISREIRGQKDITLGRVGEFGWAMGRKPVFDLPEITAVAGSNIHPSQPFTSGAPPRIPGAPPFPASTSAANNNTVPFGRVVAN